MNAELQRERMGQDWIDRYVDRTETTELSEFRGPVEPSVTGVLIVGPRAGNAFTMTRDARLRRIKAAHRRWKAKQ